VVGDVPQCAIADDTSEWVDHGGTWSDH